MVTGGNTETLSEDYSRVETNKKALLKKYLKALFLFKNGGYFTIIFEEKVSVSVLILTR